MRWKQRSYPALSLLLLALVFAATVYKACTQSITIDEAFTYERFVAAPFSSFYFYDGPAGSNNHPLNTLLCRASVAVFPLSEFTLRLPSVLLGLLYFASVYRIALLCFGPSVWLLLTVALNCATPLVLDHFALRALSKGETRWSFPAAGAALGLSAASFLTEGFAVAGLAAAVLLIYLAGCVRRAGWRGVFPFLRRVALPLVGTGLAAVVGGRGLEPRTSCL